MSYTNTYNIPASETATGAQGFKLPTDISFSQIFDGAPQFYTGSSIEVAEELTLGTRIIPGLDHLVDVDMRWYTPKTYMGTYQYSSNFVGIYSDDSQGYINDIYQTITRRSRYTVTSDPSVPTGIGEQFKLDNCNYQLGEITATIGGVGVKLQTPTSNDNLFRGVITDTSPPLKLTAKYNPFFVSVGLYLYPGCEFLSATQKIRIINVVPASLTPYPDFSCTLLGG